MLMAWRRGSRMREKHDVKVLGWVTGRLEELIPEMGRLTRHRFVQVAISRYLLRHMSLYCK